MLVVCGETTEVVGEKGTNGPRMRRLCDVRAIFQNVVAPSSSTNGGGGAQLIKSPTYGRRRGSALEKINSETWAHKFWGIAVNAHSEQLIKRLYARIKKESILKCG